MNRHSTKTIVRLASLFLLALSSLAHAEQGCPPGQIPHGGTSVSTCGPIPGQQQASPPEPAWIPQWQSLAGDSGVGALGISKGLRTSAEAQNAALNDCRAKGGKSCTTYVTNGNGCIAMVIGSKQFWIETSESLASAEQKAGSTCSSGDTECKVLYSNCSLAVRVQ
ncbi:DUF4189 domain-containing protein [Luteibacter yeojuensis]|uniref:DUF4189 domain-containing protein n=1 Tax=Luteibacter yeojuensis TaxID=345309 RepID=UPI000A063B76|nr:DUF4189 domain-containing protein [Luteibacter yeojuensis]